MSVAVQIGLAVASVAVLLGLMALVRKGARAMGLGSEVQRKLVHVGTGLYALTLPWLFPERWPVYMLIGLTLAVMLLLRLPRFANGIGGALHGVERRSYGDVLLAASVGLCFFFANGDALLYVLPLAVLTLADAAAALVGTRYATRLYRVEEGYKSVEGTVAFSLVTLLLSIICLMFLVDLPPGNILALSVMVTGFASLVEAQSWRGFDNLFLPLGLLVFLSVHVDSNLVELVVFAVLFLIAIVGFRLVGTRAGLSAHACRVYVVAMFLVLAVTAPQNALLPALVLLSHAWAKVQAPGQDDHGDLDVVAALAIISFGWLALGDATGWSAIGFYGLTAMGMTMGLSVIALCGHLPWIILISLGLLGLREAVIVVNSDASNWAEPLGGARRGDVGVDGAHGQVLAMGLCQRPGFEVNPLVAVFSIDCIYLHDIHTGR
ncbi:hypothetical protein FDP25_12940 [Roseovarius sp. A21]|uniref:Phytol kinase n=1 Tax=Roseovarius bejariae TaxID=2576383 RepID=A0A844CP12_9RHOB|nr:hypothetical protein [Roseovarius bejariae]MRU16342.1 hypothetical protein [Roseovarius bejariae]